VGGVKARSLLSMLVLLATVLIVACGTGDDLAGTSPGYSDGAREIDRSPFRLATPTTGGGPTTIPGGPTLPGETTILGNPEVTDFTTSTTTTTLPDRVPIPTAGDLVCRSFFIVATGIKNGQAQFAEEALTPGTVRYSVVRDALVAALQEASATLSASFSSDVVVDVPTALLRRLRSMSAFVASTQSFQDGGSLLVPLIVEAPFAGEPLGWPEIEGSIAGTCPELLLALTGRPTLN